MNGKRSSYFKCAKKKLNNLGNEPKGALPIVTPSLKGSGDRMYSV